MVLGNLDRYMQKMKLDHLLTPNTRVNSKWIENLNVRPETIKILEENIGSKILDIACINFFRTLSPQARETKNKQVEPRFFKKSKLKAVFPFF